MSGPPIKRVLQTTNQTSNKKPTQTDLIIMANEEGKDFNLHEYYMGMINNRYKNEDMGPFNIYIFDKDPEKCLGNLHEMAIAREFRKVNNLIQRVKKMDKFKVMVCCVSAIAANKLVESEIQNINKDWMAVIPDTNVKSIGIIGDIPLNIDDKDILESICRSDPHSKVFAVERMKKRDPNEDKTRDGRVKLIPTAMVKIFVYGTALPNNIVIDNVERKVRHFYPKVKRCNNCLRFGHYQNICKGSTRCGKCSGTHETIKCNNNYLHCVHCQSSNHDSLSMICPQFLKEKKINKIKQEKRISYQDAKSLVNHNNKQNDVDSASGSGIQFMSNEMNSDSSSNSTGTTVGTTRQEIPQGHLLLNLNKSFMIEIDKFSKILIEIVGNEENVVRAIKLAEDRYKNLYKCRN